jgi:hypothetical protein
MDHLMDRSSGQGFLFRNEAEISHLGVALLPKMSRTIASPIHAEARLGSVSAFTAPPNPSKNDQEHKRFFPH